MDKSTTRRQRPLNRRSVIAAGLTLPLSLSGWQASRIFAAVDESSPLVVMGEPIRAIATDPSSGTIFAVGERALYRTDDAGDSWATVGPTPPSGKLAIATGDPDLLLIGNEPDCARGGGGAILQRSDDGGGSWREMTEAGEVRPLGIWPTKHIALGAGCAGLLRSDDGAATWASTSSLDLGLEVTAFAPILTDDPVATPAVLVAFTSEGGYSNIQRVVIDPAEVAGPRQMIREYWGLAAIAARGDRIVVGDASGVWVSDDDGLTWPGGRTGLELVTVSVDPALAPIPDDELARGYGVFAVTIDPANLDRLVAGTINGVFLSDDAGARWAQLPGVDGRVNGVTIATEPSRLFAEAADGVFIVPL